MVRAWSQKCGLNRPTAPPPSDGPIAPRSPGRARLAFCDLPDIMTKTDIDWIAVRADYEARKMTVLALVAEHGVGRRALYDRVRDQGWRRRSAIRPSTRTGLIGRLYRLLERQIRELEMNTGEFGDKEATILGNLTRNLEKLAELDRKEKGGKPAMRKLTDIAVLRKKLAERIDRLIGE